MAVRFRWPADASYERFVAEHGPALLRVAVLITGNRYDAEDVLQEAVISVAHKWASIREPAAALGYLRTAVTRKAVDLHRKHVPTPVAEIGERAVDEVGYLHFEADAEFVRMLRAVPPRQRAVLTLRYYADLDDKTIARVLGCSEATVRSQAFRALARLRSDLAPAEPAFGGGGRDGSR